MNEPSREDALTLCTYASSFGIALDEVTAMTMVAYLDCLERKNQHINLTRIPRERGVILNLLDSLLFLRGLPNGEPIRRMVDIGTGAGFPGVPLAMMLGCETKLIDSIGKKIAAVKEMMEATGISLPISARATRVEDFAQQEPTSSDLVVSRAVAETAILMEYAAPLLTMGGRLVLSKARLDPKEVAHASSVEALLGMKLVSRETFSLPCNSGEREILCYQKDRAPKLKLPRRVGMATNKPLYLRFERA